MLITDHFDSGNIEVRSIDGDTAELAVRDDAGGEFRQWFNFEVHGAAGRDLTLRIVNAHECSYTSGWKDYRAVVSHDGEDWVRTGTSYDEKTLEISVRPEGDILRVAYFAPYPLERHRQLIARSVRSPRVRHSVPGLTVDGRPLDVLTLGNADSKRPAVWVIARQHPGESMAEWWMEGFLERMTDEADPVSRALLDLATLHVVPNMNPDGTVRGHLRTNAAGANLNREWAEPSAERSPEVLHVRGLMEQTGVHTCLDVHGDEGLPVNFLAGYHGIPDLKPEHIARFDRFSERLDALSPDFQTERGYPKAPAGKGNLSICTSFIAHHFGACSMTLEMPFKDADNHPDPVRGWSPARAKHLARACIDALYGELRAEVA